VGVPAINGRASGKPASAWKSREPYGPRAARWKPGRRPSTARLRSPKALVKELSEKLDVKANLVIKKLF
jgi:hypothetical protein